jgi:pimeloyl-ACP methyl ester carboxylesterase
MNTNNFNHIKMRFMRLWITGGIIMALTAGFLTWSWAGTMIHRFAKTDGDYVVLLHGLGNNPLSMEICGYHLRKEGYNVINVGYPSLRYDLATLSELYLDKAISEQCTDPKKQIHFVTHSMGGILLRQYLHNNPTRINLGRVIMLAPPNKGSEVADFVKEHPALCSLIGPSGSQLGTSQQDAPSLLGPVAYEVGVIAGDKPFHPFTDSLITGRHDGLVAVEHARVDGMSGFIVVPCSHSLIVADKRVQEQISAFLKTGKFISESQFKKNKGLSNSIQVSEGVNI